MKTLVVVLFILIMSLMAQAETVRWSDLQKNIDSWIDGPVSVLLADQEREVYGKLKTPEEKMQFIKIFWARRDPILRTTENEFKAEFFRRVEHANKNFAEKNVPGWKTARGRTYILFGPPSRVDHQSIEGSSRPALLWVYDKRLPDSIPPNEALMFVFRDFKYVLAPPNPQPGDRIAQVQREVDASLRYQDIPSAVEQAFDTVVKRDIVDEKKNYDPLIFSVKSTEKFQVSAIPFEPRVSEGKQVEVTIQREDAPVYDDGENTFAEFFVKQELKQGEQTVSSEEETVSFSWTSKEYADLKSVAIPLKKLNPPAGAYELQVTVQDRISGVSETRKVPISY